MRRTTSLTNAAIVTKFWLLCSVAIVVGVGGSTALALDPMGPPMSRTWQGQFSFGSEFLFNETDIELTNGKWVESSEGVFEESGVADDVTLKDFQTIKLYGTVGYGFAKNWEVFARVGAAKAEMGDSMWDDGEDFDSGIELAVGAGVRATFFEFYQPNIKIGALAQLNWAKFDGKLDATQWPAPDFVEISLAEAQFAVGATYVWRDRVTFFGGPFAHFISGDVEDTFSDYDYTWDFEEGPIYGGYIGAAMNIYKNCVLSLEYQQSSDANAFGAGLMLKY